MPRATHQQQRFRFPVMRGITSALRPGEIVVDLFAGGGGASEALLQSLGRDPDIAINHDEFAIGMHAANHPFARHLCEDVWQVDPRREVAGRAVGWMHGSPDCTHFSQAKGGQPRSRAKRSLSWAMAKWGGQVLPRILSLENVTQILKWGPLIAKRCPSTGRVITLDMVSCPKTGRRVHRVAAPGERVPVQRQFLIPDPRHEGRTWRAFVKHLRHLGYSIEWRKLRACDHGAGTSRTRLFVLARRDQLGIRWPEPTHGPGCENAFVTAADCIDFSEPCQSIFGRKRALAEATQRRIARGLQRFVIDAAEPFVVHATHHGERPGHGASQVLPTITAANRGELMACCPTLAPLITEHANASHEACWSPREPLRTVCAGVKGGHFALVGATLIQTGYGEREGQAPRVPGLHKPMGTLVDGGKHALVTAYLEQANGGPRNVNAAGHSCSDPVSTITQSGSQQRLVTAHLVTLRRNSTGSACTAPLATIAAQGEHHALIQYQLSSELVAGAERVAAFMAKHSAGAGKQTVQEGDSPGMVTVDVGGARYVIVDIGLRMLRPRELYAAQGFPDDYNITHTADGRALTTTQAVRMVGNSVSPPVLAALARCNLESSPHEQGGRAAPPRTKAA